METGPGTSGRDRPRLEMTEVAPGVHAIELPVAAAGDEARDAPHVYWVPGADRGALIDVGYGDAERADTFSASWVALTAGLPALDRPPLLLLTDRYGEHVDGAAAFKARTGAEVALGRGDVEAVQTAADDARLIDLPLDGDESFELGGSRRIVAVPTPGHTPGSMSYVVKDEGILFTGDFILGTETSTTIDPDGAGDMAAHVASLKRARDLEPRLILSFHGPPVADPIGKIDRLLERRQEREDQVIALLAEGIGEVDEIRARMYEGLADGLRNAAKSQVLANLIKLAGEGRAVEIEPGRSYRAGT